MSFAKKRIEEKLIGAHMESADVEEMFIDGKSVRNVGLAVALVVLIIASVFSVFFLGAMYGAEKAALDPVLGSKAEQSSPGAVIVEGYLAEQESGGG